MPRSSPVVDDDSPEAGDAISWEAGDDISSEIDEVGVDCLIRDVLSKFSLNVSKNDLAVELLVDSEGGGEREGKYSSLPEVLWLISEEVSYSSLLLRAESFLFASRPSPEKINYRFNRIQGKFKPGSNPYDSQFSADNTMCTML